MDNSTEEKDTKNIADIYSLKGNNKELWESLKLDINKENQNDNIINFIKNKILEDPNNKLNFDIIDYIIDKGSDIIIGKIFQKDFFDVLINKTIINNNENIKNKEIPLYLLQKWSNKFNEKYKLLIEKYKEFKNNGIIFPEIPIKTYEKYLQNETNNNKNNIENNNNNDNNIGGVGLDLYALDNPFEDNNDNLYENVDFPEDDKFENKFSNLRTSDIPSYFKYLRSKSIIENINSNDKENNENINNEENNDNNENKDNKENENKKEEEKKIEPEQKKNTNTNMNVLLNTQNKNNWTSTFQNYRQNPLLFQNRWKDKISSLNKLIKEGKNSKNFETLKEGIRQILIGYDEIEEIIMTCAKIGDDDGRNKLSYIKSDIEQVCYRYECLLQGKKVEKFKSAFDGNVKKYYFYKERLFEEDDNNININDIEDQKKEKRRNRFGRAIKNIFKKNSKSKSKSKEKNKSKEKELDNLGSFNI